MKLAIDIYYMYDIKCISSTLVLFHQFLISGRYLRYTEILSKLNSGIFSKTDYTNFFLNFVWLEAAMSATSRHTVGDLLPVLKVMGSAKHKT